MEMERRHTNKKRREVGNGGGRPAEQVTDGLIGQLGAKEALL